MTPATKVIVIEPGMMPSYQAGPASSLITTLSQICLYVCAIVTWEIDYEFI